jgi:hypothetical protein
MNVCQILMACLLVGTVTDDPQANEVLEEALSGPRWEIAPEVSFFRYREPGVMKDSGLLYGTGVAYTRDRPRGLLRLEGSFSFGLVDYEGSLMDGTPYTMEKNRDYLLNLRLLRGYPWQACDWDNQFYAGLGYRGLNDDSTHDWAGYDRQSNYLYVPLGLKTYHGLAGHWQIGLGGELDLLLFGLQFSGTTEEGDPVINLQFPGFGARASMELRHKTKSLDLAIAPFAQYWWIEESNTSHGWYEPRNNTFQYGASLIWRF